MAIHMTKPGDRVPVGTINVLIYGQPATGKTSLCYTMSNPLVIDFDGGAHRSQQSVLGTTVRVDSWSDVEEVMTTIVKDYDTIVIDTVGSALDYMAAYIIQTNPKMGTVKGTLTMQGWGELKAVFQQWFKRLNVAGKNVVMIAHHKEEKEGDSTRKRPDIQGSSYGLVMKQADFVGFAYLNEASKRVIGFAPTADYFGKDSARLGIVAVDDYESNPEFGSQLISKMKAAFQDLAEENEKVAKVVQEWRKELEAMTDAIHFNQAIPFLKQLEDPAAGQVRKLVTDRVKELGLKFNKSKGKYEADNG